MGRSDQTDVAVGFSGISQAGGPCLPLGRSGRTDVDNFCSAANTTAEWIASCQCGKLIVQAVTRLNLDSLLPTGWWTTVN